MLLYFNMEEYNDNFNKDNSKPSTINPFSGLVETDNINSNSLFFQTLDNRIRNLENKLQYVLFGQGSPTWSSTNPIKKGTLYINLTASTTTTRLYISTGSAWAYLTASA